MDDIVETFRTFFSHRLEWTAKELGPHLLFLRAKDGTMKDNGVVSPIGGVFI